MLYQFHEQNVQCIQWYNYRNQLKQVHNQESCATDSWKPIKIAARNNVSASVHAIVNYDVLNPTLLMHVKIACWLMEMDAVKLVNFVFFSFSTRIFFRSFSKNRLLRYFLTIWTEIRHWAEKWEYCLFLFYNHTTRANSKMHKMACV